MSDTSDPNAGQRDFWNSPTGERWVRHQAQLDGSFEEITDRLLALVAPGPGMRLLDIGCGAGGTSLAAAGRGAAVTGIDISTALLARARERAEGAGPGGLTFLEADAQTHAFPAGSFDAALSRFGVMFFADPPAAFRTIRGALVQNGGLAFACWAGLAVNPWFRVPREAAIAHHGPVPPAEPREPGPMAFEEPGYVAEILQSAGFEDVSVDTKEVALRPPGTFEDAVDLTTIVGPAARVMRDYDATEADRTQVKTLIAEGFAPYRQGDTIAVPAVLHFVTARNPG